MQKEARMNIEHKSKTLEIPPRILAYLNEKVSRFDKFFRKEPTLGANLTSCEVSIRANSRLRSLAASSRLQDRDRTWKVLSTLLATSSMCRSVSSTPGSSGRTSRRLPNSRVCSSLKCRWKKLRNLLRVS